MVEIVSPTTVAAASRDAGDIREGAPDYFWLARIGDLTECFRRESIEVRAAFSGEAESQTVAPGAVKTASLSAYDARSGSVQAGAYARIGDVLECIRQEQIALRAILVGEPATEIVSVAAVTAASVVLGEPRTGSNETAMLARIADLLECCRREYVAVKDALPGFLTP